MGDDGKCPATIKEGYRLEEMLNRYLNGKGEITAYFTT
jgi:hypothetical protein